ncbi:MAG: acyl--CoA ligase [Rhodobacteraceae bacterium]|nr:acyl--CoA ligase [Paracoccaceae bacterium]
MDSVIRSAPPAAPPSPYNMARDVLAAGARTPDKSALQVLRASGAERWSYARLIAAVRGTGAGLLALGLAPGDRVLLRLGNSVDFPIAFLGAIAAGLVPVPTSAQLTAPEITAMAMHLDPSLVVAGDGVTLPEHPAPVQHLPALRAMRDSPPCDWHLGPPDRPGYMVFTSGSSGAPMAVVHAHRALHARRMMWDGWYGLTPDDRVLHAGAFNWTYTLGTGLMDPWTIGATALIPEPGAPLALLMRRFDATLFAAAPGVYRQLLKPGTPLALPRLRHGLSAGEKLPETTRAAWEAATGTPVFEALGMSECSTYISAAPGRPAPAGAIGYAQPGRSIAVLDGTGRPVPRGTPGTLAVHRSDPGLMLDYWRAPAATAARFTGDWFVTGDTVVMDGDGAITYLGREDDMLNAGGFRVSPLEIEAALERHPDIHEVAATELAVRADTTVIAAFYTAAAPLPEATLQAHAQAHLARYKQPRLHIHCQTLPRGANNKLLRRVLRDDWERTHDRA